MSRRTAAFGAACRFNGLRPPVGGRDLAGVQVGFVMPSCLCVFVVQNARAGGSVSSPCLCVSVVFRCDGYASAVVADVEQGLGDEVDPSLEGLQIEVLAAGVHAAPDRTEAVENGRASCRERV